MTPTSLLALATESKAMAHHCTQKTAVPLAAAFTCDHSDGFFSECGRGEAIAACSPFIDAVLAMAPLLQRVADGDWEAEGWCFYCEARAEMDTESCLFVAEHAPDCIYIAACKLVNEAVEK